MTDAKILTRLQATLHRIELRRARRKAARKECMLSGNFNPLFKPADRQNLPTGSFSGTENEIAMLRMLIRRLFEYTMEAEMDLRDLCDAVAALGNGAARLDYLLLPKNQSAGAGEDIAETAITQAVLEMIEEIGLK